PFLLVPTRSVGTRGLLALWAISEETSATRPPRPLPRWRSTPRRPAPFRPVPLPHTLPDQPPHSPAPADESPRPPPDGSGRARPADETNAACPHGRGCAPGTNGCSPRSAGRSTAPRKRTAAASTPTAAPHPPGRPATRPGAQPLPCGQAAFVSSAGRARP